MLLERRMIVTHGGKDLDFPLFLSIVFHGETNGTNQVSLFRGSTLDCGPLCPVPLKSKPNLMIQGFMWLDNWPTCVSSYGSSGFRLSGIKRLG